MRNEYHTGRGKLTVVPRPGIEPGRSGQGAADFKSAVSANFTIEAVRGL